MPQKTKKRPKKTPKVVKIDFGNWSAEDQDKSDKQGMRMLHDSTKKRGK